MAIIIKENSTICDLYGANISTYDINRSLMPFINFIKMFLDKYIPSRKNNFSLESGWHRQSAKKNTWEGSIIEIYDIEENVWSPSLGMKGKIDITMEVICISIHHFSLRFSVCRIFPTFNIFSQVNDVKLGNHKLPLELKTGLLKTPSSEDKCQVTLYSIMMNQERKSEYFVEHEIVDGLLLYIQSGLIYHVTAEHNEKRDLVQKRNELVNYLISQVYESENGKPYVSPLPPAVELDRLCSKCPLQVVCAIYQVSCEFTI